MLKFISFGSGSCGNCYYLFTGDEGLMIDCGIGVRSLRKFFDNYGFKLVDIKNILITHDHADHVKSIGALSGSLHVPVYTTSAIHSGIEQNWYVRKKILSELKYEIEKNTVIEIGPFRVTTFSVPHDSKDNVGYSIEYEDKVFTIVTDCGHVTEEIEMFIRKSNYLVLEANYDSEMLENGHYPPYLKRRISGGIGHLSNRQCGEALVKNATPLMCHIWLCHLSEDNNHPELARKTVDAILRSSGIIPGKDFELDVLKRKTPSVVFEL